MGPLHDLLASEALPLLARGEISSEDLVRSCLARIGAEEPRVGAWAFLDEELALAQARRIDGTRPRPSLAGLPVGVKDIIDTADMPTECGSPALRGRRPDRDAACVAALRAAGAVILGKTVTTEFAFYSPGKTRNPHDPARTPGGSSSGSAAAVACGMVPLALGSQTAGSVIRPASFCGVVGLKPSHGLLSLQGVSPLAPSLDTLGCFARSVADLPPLLAALGAPLPRAEAPQRPRLALCRTEQWPLAAAESRAAVEQAADRLARAGAAVREVEPGPEFTGLPEAQRIVMAVEAARALGEARARHQGRMSRVLLDLLDQGAATAPADYQAALAQAARCRRLVPRLFEGTDALLTPSAVGEAPLGLSITGNPAFNRIWTLLGLPCLSLPGASGPSGMPVGIQLVGPGGGEAALLAVASWVAAGRLS
jgi:Asp-tRNA(Asn)/Glu-tRNA(Gln) amidotransferase A subunit family amidase